MKRSSLRNLKEPSADLQPVIQIQSLSKKYRDAEMYSLSDFSMVIQSGEILGLLGPNGAGKTTLISMLCGLVEPSSGDISIHGLNYRQQGNTIRQIIGVVPQEYALYPTLTAYENLMYFGSMYGIPLRKLRIIINDSLSKLGLEKFANKKIETFSGGMKRRVNLIAGVMHTPKVLFLDEPTVGVDVQSKQVIIEFLKQLNSEGTTIIYTSHHLVEAQHFCTDIVILDQGKIYAQGTPKMLIDQTPGASNLEDVFISLTGKNMRDDI